MPIRESADIVFCLDASHSMSRLFRSVADHVGAFLAGLRWDANRTWDVRFDFLAFKTVRHGNPTYRSVGSDDPVRDLYQCRDESRFFTTDLERFRSALLSVKTSGDESGPLALSACLDFPFRDARTCHRAVLLFTDERIETGTHIDAFRDRKPSLAMKIAERGIAVHIVAPKSAGYEFLSQVDGSEYTVLADKTRAFDRLDFGTILRDMGRSVSASGTSAARNRPFLPKPLFGERDW